jgi:exosortase
MRSAVENDTSEAVTTPTHWEKRDWFQAGVLTALIAILYFPVLIKLGAAWWGDPNFSHGFFVPLFSGLVVWVNRKRLAAIPREPTSSGLVVIALALCALVVGILGAEFFLSRCSLVLLLAGVLIYLRGWRFFNAILFPWACLFLMIPIPTLILNKITFPMQLFATMFAHWMLVLFGIPVLREGNILRLPSMSAEVAQACSGIRSLMTLITLAVFYGYFGERTAFRRAVLVLAAGPIAVAANGLRIVATCVSVQYWGPTMAIPFFHTIEGLFILGVSMLMFLLVHRLMK